MTEGGYVVIDLKDVTISPPSEIEGLKNEIEKLRQEKEEEAILKKAQIESLQDYFRKENEDRSRMNEALKDKVKLLQTQLSDATLGQVTPNGPRGPNSAAVTAGVASKEISEVEINMKQIVVLKEELKAAKMEIARKDEALQNESAKLASVRAELEAAREELAVKVAQVKQYQKQVEVYKQQVGILNIKTETAEKEAAEASEVLIIELHNPVGEQHQLSQGGPVSVTPSLFSADTPDLVSTSHPCVTQGDTLGPPPYEKDQPVPHQMKSDHSEHSDSHVTLRSSNSAEHRVPPIHQVCAHGSSKVSHGIVVLPPPPPQFGAAKHENKGVPSSCNASVPSTGNDSCSIPSTGAENNIDGKPSRVTGDHRRHIDRREFEETNPFAPLDQNLKCPFCEKVFKKGEIQKYRYHGQECMRGR